MRRFVLALALTFATGFAHADEGYRAPWKTFRLFETNICLGDVPALISCDVRLPTLQLVPEEEGRVVLSGTTFCVGKAAEKAGCDVRIPPAVPRPKVAPWVEKVKERIKKWDAKVREDQQKQ